MLQKSALITGITGQDGSYLAEFLLNKGYTVIGVIRRSSTFNTKRIEHIFQDPHEKNLRLKLVYGDLQDSSVISKIIAEYMPDEIYNLGAQSHVRISFDLPEYTGNITALGTLRVLETIRTLSNHTEKKIKFYQASSSELFGKAVQIPQNEETPFHPRSPYGCAKLYAFWITKNYRDSYGIFACNGILFNHECVSENTPLLIRNKKTGSLSFKRVKDIRRAREKGANVQQWLVDDHEIWDGDSFVELLFITATRRKKENDDFHCKTVNTRHGIVEVTNHHNLLSQNSSKVKAREVHPGDRLLHKNFPVQSAISSVTPEEALFLGMMAGDGYISEQGDGQFANNNGKTLKLMETLWRKIALGSISLREYKTEYGKAIQLTLRGNARYLRFLRDEIYTLDGFKKVPDRILNSEKEAKLAFLTGYNITDGLKANSCIYEFKNFKTNSPLLAQGLLFLIQTTTIQDYNVTFEEDSKNYGYYSLNLLSPTDNAAKEESVSELLAQGFGQREIERETGISRGFIRNIQQGVHAQSIHHLSKDKEEVKKTLYHPQQPEWVYDIETASGKFMAGVGKITIANSPRRGETFVTRKITRGVARIMEGIDSEIYLGNLDAKRDWGFAGDYVEAMWLILQQDTPDDYVIATGETHSVREFLEETFRLGGIEIVSNGKKGIEEEYIRKDNGKVVVKIDKRYFRPAEVDLLLGDSQKARQKLGWKPTVHFKELVAMMLQHDIKELRRELYGNKNGN